jgi:hypothetical protein
MAPPTPHLSAVETIGVLRQDLAVLPDVVRWGDLTRALEILAECRVQLAELGDLIAAELTSPCGPRALPVEPPLTWPGGHPGEHQSDPADQPLW